MRRALRLAVGLAAVVAAALVLMSSSGAQTPGLPPGFTFPTFPDITTPPPTMPPPTTSTTSPPPTMPPSTTSTSSPPPTMPPTTLPNFDDTLDARIEDIIDRLEEFGDEFAGIIDELRDLAANF